MKRSRLPFILLASVLVPVLLVAHANYSGRTLKSGTAGCAGCHATRSTSVVVSIAGPDSLAPGVQGTFTVTVSGGSGTAVYVDIAASAGTLTPADANLKSTNGELITNGTKRYANGSYTYTFLFTAPSTTQEVTLFATGASTKNSFNFAPNKTVVIGGGVTSTEAVSGSVPEVLTVLPNYPNPFNPGTTFTYITSEAGIVTASFHAVDGRQVAAMYEGRREPGTWTLRWEGTTVPSGTYICRIQLATASGRTHAATTRVILAK